ncbi:MAG TPA: GGDEF domain-containing protein [Candidatus Binatia bacterium]|nr:GGDEF domain-containing protein [Candidatus Binatia bacterium]
MRTATSWTWLGVALVGGLLTLAFVALPAGSVEQSAVYDAAGLAAIAAALYGIRLHRPASRQPWLLLALGQLSFVAGDIIWTTLAALGEDPFPSPADAAYLLGYPILAVGLGVAIRRRIAGGDRAGLLDGAILATGAAVVWWTFVLGPLTETSDPDPVGFLFGIAYPLGDLLLIGMALGLLVAPGARSTSFRLLVANLLALLVGDLVFGLQSVAGTYVDGGLLDVTWLAGYVLFGMAATHPSMARVFEPSPISVALLGPVRIVLLAVAMLVGPALLLVDHANESSVVLVVAGASAIVSILVLVRLAGMVRNLSRDIQRREVLEAQLSYQAHHDPLTGLANRRRFFGAVHDVLDTGKGLTVLFIDLDDFKDVNDGLGHDAGDALLTEIGRRLVAVLRPNDLGCRIGGDEFAALLPGLVDPRDGEMVARRVLEVLARPLTIEGRELSVRASIGVAAADADEAVSVDELLRRADVAMYHAKAAGKHCVAIFAPGMDSPAAAVQGAHAGRGGPFRHVRPGRQPTPQPGSA